MRTFLEQGGGILQMQTSAFFLAQKTLDFSKFMVCPHGQGGRGFDPVLSFFGKDGKGVNF